MAAGKFGHLLIEEGLVNQEQLSQAVQHARNNNLRLGSSLVQLGHVNENAFASFAAKLYGLSAVSLDGVEISKELIELVPRTLCEKHTIVPLRIEENSIVIAVSDPTNVAVVDDVRFVSNMEVRVAIATESAIRSAVARFYGTSNEADEHSRYQKRIARQLQGDEKSSGEEGDKDEAHEVESRGGDDKPIVKLINSILIDSIRRGASDVHIEPMSDYSRVRFRLDGVLHEIMRLPKSVRRSVPARIKVMSALDISESRLPQDGRLRVKARKRHIDVRVSILPTVLGEKVVMRLLDQGDSQPSLKKIGFEDQQYAKFKVAAEQPYGMILVTGPTGSGKSTTLYGALSELNGPDVNISTVEDPVEYRMGGANQVQMKEGIGLTFASALRSLLRQDPDVIMVGEIRDQETAEIAVKASLTGHMVFSTLHTNDAPSTISRLLHMGLEPFLITAAVTLVEAQRLVRSLCGNCKQPDPEATEEQLLAAEVPKDQIGTFTAYVGAGCEQCGNTGYKGRLGVFEVMPMTEKLRELIVHGANADQLKKEAMAQGMITLRQAAIAKLQQGKTSLEEVLSNSRPDGDVKR